MHGPDHSHNTNNCKVINAKIERLKGQKPSFSNNKNQWQDSNAGGSKKTWTESKKHPATTYSTKQLKEVVRMTRNKALEDAKVRFDTQVQEEMHTLEIDNDAFQEEQKMQVMELFINIPIKDENNMEDKNDELTQAEFDELTASFSD
jgi:hypothetical protein